VLSCKLHRLQESYDDIKYGTKIIERDAKVWQEKNKLNRGYMDNMLGKMIEHVKKVKKISNKARELLLESPSPTPISQNIIGFLFEISKLHDDMVIYHAEASIAYGPPLEH